MSKRKGNNFATEFWPDFVAYTDGGYIIPKGFGASACVILDKSGKEIYSWSKVCCNSTNNRQELGAIIHAVLHTPEDSNLLVYSDSRYSIGVLSGEMRGKKNPDLIAYYKRFVSGRRINVAFRWVPGHAGNKWNEVVDAMCTEAMEEYERRSNLDDHFRQFCEALDAED